MLGGGGGEIAMGGEGGGGGGGGGGVNDFHKNKVLRNRHCLLISLVQCVDQNVSRNAPPVYTTVNIL